VRARGRFVAAEILVAGRIRQGGSDGVFGFLKKSPEKAATAWQWWFGEESWQTGIETRFAEKISHRKTVGQPGIHSVGLSLNRL
jgi:hypothetical protein